MPRFFFLGNCRHPWLPVQWIDSQEFCTGIYQNLSKLGFRFSSEKGRKPESSKWHFGPDKQKLWQLKVFVRTWGEVCHLQTTLRDYLRLRSSFRHVWFDFHPQQHSFWEVTYEAAGHGKTVECSDMTAQKNTFSKLVWSHQVNESGAGSFFVFLLGPVASPIAGCAHCGKQHTDSAENILSKPPTLAVQRLENTIILRGSMIWE